LNKTSKKKKEEEIPIAKKKMELYIKNVANKRLEKK
jgi:hypothetical protein